jgi:hypothetical protein
MGRWALITDLIHADLASAGDAPFEPAFRAAEGKAQLTRIGACAAYSVIDAADLRLDLVAGFRYADARMDVDLSGNAAPSKSLSFSDAWIDPLLGARLRHDFLEGRFGAAFADIGGSGMDEPSDLT